MHNHIIKTWNKTVRKKDKVYVLGDFSLNPKWSREVVPKLNGYKCLISGNHDVSHCSHKKSEKFVEKYKVEWNEVYPHNTFITLKNAMKVQLCHLPYAPKEGDGFDTRYLLFRPERETEILLHGHLHGRYIKNGDQIDVSWDAHNGKIISEDELIAIINDPREYIPSHITNHYKTRTENVY
jgi:calcineurin-like phosphoesterase family protein